jgi:hypothetical protein
MPEELTEMIKMIMRYKDNIELRNFGKCERSRAKSFLSKYG